MKDFLDGKAIRFYNRSGQQDNMAAFLRQCEEYGLRWANGNRATKTPMIEWGNCYAAFIWIDPNTNRLVYLYEEPRAGYKHLFDVRPLQHTFRQFVVGDFWMHVHRDEIAEFFEMAAKHNLLFSGELVSRDGQKARRVAKDGLTVLTARLGGDGPRICALAPQRYEGAHIEIADFHYIPRGCGVPRCTRRDGGAVDRAVLRARWARETSERAAATSCAPANQHPSTTGAVVTLARQLGKEEWAKAVAEADSVLKRESETKSRREIVVDSRRLKDLNPDELREVVTEIIRTAQEKAGARA